MCFCKSEFILDFCSKAGNNGIQWTPWEQLDVLDYADDLALLSHNHLQMQNKTSRPADESAKLGPRIIKVRTEVLRINTKGGYVLWSRGSCWRMSEFPYLGSVVDIHGSTDKDALTRIGKARAVFIKLKKVWAPKELSVRTKLRIFRSNVKTVLLYGSESWRTTKRIQSRIQSFVNSCLRRILGFCWKDKVTNKQLWERAEEELIALQVRRRKWDWIGHTLRKPASNTTRQALSWNPQGKRKRGRPRNSWSRELKCEVKVIGSELDRTW